MQTEKINPIFSFRARILLFVTLIFIVTTLTNYYVNRYYEARVVSLVADQLNDISLAIDLAQSSFLSTDYLFQRVPDELRERFGLDESHIIHQILVTDEQGKILDSLEKDDKDKNIVDVIEGISSVNPVRMKQDPGPDGREREQLLTYPVEVETDPGVTETRYVVIVVSPHRLTELVATGTRERLYYLLIIGLILILLTALASWRFTRPIGQLVDAARRVSSGDFDFNIPVKRRDEVGALARTFNEMLAGLRNNRELEERLQRTERSALTGRVASGIAHEIRNPLSFINLTIDYLRDKFAPTEETLRGDFTKLCDNIKEEIARLNRMVSDFLSYGRPARLHLRQIDSRALIEDVMNLVHAKATQQGINMLVEDVPGDDKQPSDRHFRGDSEQLKTCLSNLAINAVDAMIAGGTLTFTLIPQEHNIIIEVADTGTGIPPEAIEQIFEPYYSSKETGIGLGLPLTKKLIEDHGGHIFVSSEVGIGTSFTLVLPREPDVSPQNITLSQPALGSV
ncbi:MAG: ATP-binding protein [Acidobacteria bacterium]|nr:ATP-binding protein [Acidobacteriota bacterium]